MPAHQSSRRGVLLTVRITHRVTLGELAGALYMSSRGTGENLTASEIKYNVNHQIAYRGSVLGADAGEAVDYARTYYGDASTDARLSWVRTMILKAYRRELDDFPGELEDFASRPLEQLFRATTRKDTT